MSKVIKQMQMDDLKKTFGSVRDLVLMKVVGLGAIPDNKLRLDLRKKGIRLQMVKNSLARKVFADLGLEITKGWEGSTTVAWGGTSAAALAKEIKAAKAKHDKLIDIKTSVADGQEVAFDVMVEMPTREQAIGIVIGLALSAGSRVVGALLGPGGQLASQVKTLSEKKEEGAAPAEAAPPASSP